MARDPKALSTLIQAKMVAEGLFEPTSGQTKKFADALAAAICSYLDSSVDLKYNTHVHVFTPPATIAPTVTQMGG
ncbi:MAG TPA: hypothetical protein PLV42_06855 [bacterium]|nr:hypothetical protein [bacterium]